MLVVDAVRVLTGASVLVFGAACDLKWRRAPDLAWALAAAVGVILLGVEALARPAELARMAPSLATAAVVAVLAVAGYLTGLIAGGADAKALVSLSILAPVPLDPAWAVPLASRLPLVVTAVANGLAVGLAVPFALALVNVARGDVDGLRTLVATRVPTRNVREKVVWPLEYVDEEGELVTATTPGRVPLDAFDPDPLVERGRERVWVTPKIPFLVPLTFGFGVAVILGDPLASLLGLLLV